jgi:hypothetical protein
MATIIEDKITIAQPVLIQNTLGGPTVFSNPKSGEQVNWAGAGDPDGLDVQSVPISFLSDASFQRNLSNGTFSVYAAPDEILEAIDALISGPHAQRQAQSRRDQAQHSKDALAAIIVDPTTDDLVAHSCIGPGTRAGALCGTGVPIRRSESDTTAPLCAKHKHLARYCIPVEGDLDNSTGKAKITWQFVNIPKE